MFDDSDDDDGGDKLNDADCEDSYNDDLYDDNDDVGQTNVCSFIFSRVR
jgi:hypothetical protein